MKVPPVNPDYLQRSAAAAPQANGLSGLVQGFRTLLAGSMNARNLAAELERDPLAEPEASPLPDPASASLLLGSGTPAADLASAPGPPAQAVQPEPADPDAAAAQAETRDAEARAARIRASLAGTAAASAPAAAALAAAGSTGGMANGSTVSLLARGFVKFDLPSQERAAQPPPPVGGASEPLKVDRLAPTASGLDNSGHPDTAGDRYTNREQAQVPGPAVPELND
jgi:hypothetical protein